MNHSAHKTLIVSSWAPPDIGGPQNLYNLFSQFPRGSYEILTSFYTDMKRKTGAWLPCDYYFMDHRPIPLPEQLTYAEQLRKPAVDKPLAPVNWAWSMIKNVLRSIGFVKTVLLGTMLVHKTWRFYATGRAILQNDPDMQILGISDAGAAMIATYLLSRKNNRPLRYYLYDLYRGNYFGAPNNWVANFMEPRIFARAKHVIVTNEGTLEYYARRYPWLRDRLAVVHNSVFADGYEKQRTPYQPQPPYRIVFTGHVYWAQAQSVLNLIAAMKRLADLPVKLELYMPHPLPSIVKAASRIRNITITSAPQSEMPRIQSQATLLFLPLAWNTKSPDIIATATPGKFADYLASGRPMFVHAPDYAYISQYTNKHNCGLVVDQNDVGLLAKNIRDFFEHPERGQQYIDNALKIFYANHEAKKNAQKLTKLLGVI